MENEAVSYKENDYWWIKLSTEKKEIVREIIRMSWPNILSLLIMSLFDTLLYRYVGQIEPLSLASFAIGYSIVRITSITYIIGINSAVDTLISQYFGMKNYYKCAIFMYIGFIIANIFATFSFITSIFSYEILKFFSVDDQIAKGASLFAKKSIIYVYFFINFDVLKKILNAQKIVNPQFYITIFTGLLQVIHSYFYIKYFDFLGAIYSMALTNVLSVSLILFYIYYTESGKIIIMKVKFSDIYQSIPEYLKVGIPGGINIGLESFAFHILNLFSASLSVLNSATNAILMNLDIVYCNFGLGAGNAICALVGNSLGERRGKQAQSYAFLGFSFFCFLSILMGFFIIVFNYYIGHFYTSDESVLKIFRSFILLVTITIIFDAIQTASNRILTGMGYQKYAAIVIVIMYFPIMVPSAYFLKSRYELNGIWIPYFYTFLIITIFDSLIIFLTNYIELAESIANNNTKNLINNTKESNSSDKEMKLLI